MDYFELARQHLKLKNTFNNVFPFGETNDIEESRFCWANVETSKFNSTIKELDEEEMKTIAIEIGQELSGLDDMMMVELFSDESVVIAIESDFQYPEPYDC